jgi:hypothetical protein
MFGKSYMFDISLHLALKWCKNFENWSSIDKVMTKKIRQFKNELWRKTKIEI